MSFKLNNKYLADGSFPTEAIESGQNMDT